MTSSPIARPIWRIEHFPEIGSTSDWVRAQAEAGVASGVGLRADRQSAGRGTRGKTWSDGRGNLMLSVLLRSDNALRAVTSLPFAVSLAVHRALCSVLAEAERARLTLKWPNDVLLDGRKLSGVLIERGGGDRDGWIAIGVGINLGSAPAVPQRPTACLSELGAALTPAEACVAFLRELDVLLADLASDFDGARARQRAAWLKAAHPIGTQLAVFQGRQYINGSFEGLAEDGALLLGTPGGQVIRIAAGVVLHLG